ncbi:hypothetical protein [Rosistilla oblonga]|uniref:hypothetical protein n=1 Tax=Rosistilla oblonga TaxID=2527990 RepID=UPI003A968ED8
MASVPVGRLLDTHLSQCRKELAPFMRAAGSEMVLRLDHDPVEHFVPHHFEQQLKLLPLVGFVSGPHVLEHGGDYQPVLRLEPAE